MFCTDLGMTSSKDRDFADLALEIPEELRWKPRGRIGKEMRSRQWRAEARRERRRLKPYLSSLIMGNLRLLANKMDKLARSQREFRESSILCFTETWLHQDIPNPSLAFRLAASGAVKEKEVLLF